MERHAFERKPNRIPNFEYGYGVYFVTICTKEKQCLFADHDSLWLTESGEIVQSCIESIREFQNNVVVEKYVIMPNHVHLILTIENKDVQLQWVINQMKGAVTKRIGCSPWQKGFHDHVIRDMNDFIAHWQYIENNPVNWQTDEHW